MAFSMASLLIHNASIPAPARAAVKAAIDAPFDRRETLLRSAARILWHETDLECDDVRELLDLGSDVEERCDGVVDDYAMLEARA